MQVVAVWDYLCNRCATRNYNGIKYADVFALSDVADTPRHACPLSTINSKCSGFGAKKIEIHYTPKEKTGSSLTTSHFVKYTLRVYIVTLKHLREAIEDYPDAANDIKAWVAIVKAVRWHNFPEVRGTFKDADNVRGYVIFNIRQNRYHLVTVIHYAKTTAQKRTQGHVYIRSFLTHKKYGNPDNWDRRFGTK